MMKFNKILENMIKEKWLTTLKVGESDVEIFKNPSKRELNNIIKSGRNLGSMFADILRGCINIDTMDIYVWASSEGLHHTIFSKVNEFNDYNFLKFMYDKSSENLFTIKSNNKIVFNEIEDNPELLNMINNKLYYVFETRLDIN